MREREAVLAAQAAGDGRSADERGLETPLWAGIYMLPLTIGLLLAGPISGYLSDRFGARPFATGGMIAAGGGMNQTFPNSAQVLSVGIFFTLLIVGLSSSLPNALSSGLEAHGVSHGVAHHAGQTPPISVLFAAFTFAIVACLVAAVASLLRGGQYHHAEEPTPGPARPSPSPATGGATCALSGTDSPPSP